MAAVFLDSGDLVLYTGRKQKKKQIEVLKKMAVPFTVNACGKPVVAVATVEGRKPGAQAKPADKWEPKE